MMYVPDISQAETRKRFVRVSITSTVDDDVAAASMCILVGLHWATSTFASKKPADPNRMVAYYDSTASRSQ